jgi:glycine C-acetyltransferase
VRYRYKNNNMDDLERCLKESQGQRFRLIATDGVFSMDGYLANLPAICDLAEKYDAMVMVDDSHAVGFIGPNGAGTPDHFGVRDRVDIITGTLGKALGGASGGYTSGNKTVIEWLRQRSRPYLFSNTLAPVICATSIAVLDLLEEKGAELRATIKRNAQHFRDGMGKAGFELLPGEHAIIPVMLHDAALAGKMADEMLKRGIYVTGFSYPVVPQGKARIRTQMSAAHTTDHLDKAIAAFTEAGRELNILKKAA